MSYDDFLKSKRLDFKHTGIAVKDADIHPLLFLQRDLVKWSAQKGRAAILLTAAFANLHAA